MNMANINKYDLEIIEAIQKIDHTTILGTWKNNLDGLWCRNYKEKIKVGTLMNVPTEIWEKNKYVTNLFFDITPEQAREIIVELQRVLELRKK